MLEIFQKKKNSIFGFVIIAFCSLLMLPFGINLFQGGGPISNAIEVGDTEISAPLFYQRVDRWQRIFSQQFGQRYGQMKPFLNIEQRAIDGLVSEVLLDNLFQTLGLTASIKQVGQKISNQPYFQGNFTKSAYQTFLQAQGMNASQFEALSKRDVMVDQLESLLGDMAIPSEQELKASFLREGKEAAFRYVAFKSKDYVEKVDTTDKEAINDFYEENKSRYRKPRSVMLETVRFDAKDIQKTIEVSEEDIKDRFDSNRFRFVEPSQVTYTILSVPIAEASSAVEDLIGAAPSKEEKKATELSNKDLAQDKAKSLLGELQQGKTIDELKTTDDSLVVATQDWTPRKSLDTSIKRAIEKLEKGKYSEVFQNGQQFSIVLVKDSKAKRNKKLEEVHDEILAELKKEDAPEYARAAAESFLQEVRGKKLKPLAEEKKLTVVSHDEALSKGSSTPGIPPLVVSKALALNEQEQELVSVGDDTYVIEIIKVNESTIPSLTEIQDQVVSDYKAEHSRVLARQAAEQGLESLQKEDSQQTFDALAKELKLVIETTEKDKKVAAKGAIFLSPAARDSLFALQNKGDIYGEVVNSGNEFYVAELQEVSLPKEEDFAKERDTLLSSGKDRARGRLVKALIETLKSQTTITVNPQILSKS